MAGGRRVRRRAVDLAGKQKRSSRSGIIMMGVILLVIIIFKFSVGDESAQFFETLVGQQSVQLPESVLDKRRNALVSDGAHGGGTMTAPVQEEVE